MTELKDVDLANRKKERKKETKYLNPEKAGFKCTNDIFLQNDTVACPAVCILNLQFSSQTKSTSAFHYKMQDPSKTGREVSRVILLTHALQGSATIEV